MSYTASGCEGITYKVWRTTGPESYDADNTGTYMIGYEVSIGASKSVSITSTLSPGM